MTKSPRRVHDSAFKTKVVLEALKGAKTLSQLATEFGIHPQQITERTGAPVEEADSQWLAISVQFTNGQTNVIRAAARRDRRTSLSTDWATKGGRRAVENDWLKKKLRTN